MKAVGFYRLLPAYPTPAVILFREEEGSPTRAQVVDREGVVTAIVPFSAELADRVIVEGGDTTTAECEIGQEAQYAVALSAERVVVGKRSILQRTLREYADRHKSEIRPFDLLEFALFISDDALIAEAAAACKDHLERVAPSLVSRWIDGSPLAPKYKARLRTAPEVKRGAPKRKRYIRLGFSGPFNLMRRLTTFSEGMGVTRASIVREMFEADDLPVIIEEVYPLIDRTIRALNAVMLEDRGERGPYAWLPSRGAVYVGIQDADAYLAARTKFSAAVYSSDAFDVYSAIPAVGVGQESLSFILISCYLALRYPTYLATPPPSSAAQARSAAP